MVVEPIFGGQEAQKAQNVKNKDLQKRDETIQASKTGSADSVELSGSAKQASQIQQAIETVKSVPEVARKDKVEAAKERILGGNYLSPKVVDQIAEKIANLLLK